MTEDLKNALSVLKEGGTILYPTDTIWGIGCDATNEKAVEKIYKIKRRKVTKSMLILLDSENRLNTYISEVPEVAYDLIEAANTPLTIIYSSAKNLAKNLLGEDQSVGIRISEDEFCKQLIFNIRKPIVSTSANISGSPSPANFDEIEEEIKDAVDYVVEWRRDDLKKSKASSIIKLGLSGQIEVLRK